MVELIGIPSQGLGLSGDGYSGKTGDYHRMRGKFRKVGFTSVSSFGLGSTDFDSPMRGWEELASATFSYAGDDGGYAILVMPTRNAVGREWFPIATKAIRILRPFYGIAFRRDVRLGPAFCSIGVNQELDPVKTGAAYEEARTVSRWGDMGMVKQVYRDGLLRDVYPWNLLTEAHLSRRTGTQTFRQWIDQSSGRGVQTPMSDGVSLWEVDESTIPEIREVLNASGAIFDWRKCA